MDNKIRLIVEFLQQNASKLSEIAEHKRALVRKYGETSDTDKVENDTIEKNKRTKITITAKAGITEHKRLLQQELEYTEGQLYEANYMLDKIWDIIA